MATTSEAVTSDPTSTQVEESVVCDAELPPLLLVDELEDGAPLPDPDGNAGGPAVVVVVEIELAVVVEVEEAAAVVVEDEVAATVVVLELDDEAAVVTPLPVSLVIGTPI